MLLLPTLYEPCCSLFGWACSTEITRSCTSVLFNASIAFWAASSSSISTYPNPLDCPVKPSFTTSEDFTSPNGVNNWLNSSSPITLLKLYTYIFRSEEHTSELQSQSN